MESGAGCRTRNCHALPRIGKYSIHDHGMAGGEYATRLLAERRIDLRGGFGAVSRLRQVVGFANTKKDFAFDIAAQNHGARQRWNAWAERTGEQRLAGS